MNNSQRYVAFKKAMKEIEKNPDVQYIRMEDFILVPARVWDAGVERVKTFSKEYKLATSAISGRPN